MRLLILIGLIYLIYRAVKAWWLKAVSSQQTMSHQGMTEIDDVMVQDPVCKVYFAKRDGVHLKYQGRDYYFCSQECRDRFEAAHQE